MNKYYYLLRPPGIGCQPDNSVEREMWYPVGLIPGGSGRHAHGWVTYNDPLPRETVWRFDLLPDDTIEQLNYFLWLQADRKEAEMQWFIEDYTAVGLEELGRLRERGDFVAELVLGLIEARGA